jgi:hypothetical protein
MEHRGDPVTRELAVELRQREIDGQDGGDW